MSHLIRTRLDPASAPSDKQDRFQNWLDSYQTVGTDSGYTEHAARKDDTMPAYDEFTGRFSVHEDVTTILTDLLDNRFPDVSWAVVHTRRDDAEASDYDADETYYDPELDNGVRSTPTFDRTGRFDLEYENIYAVVGGSEVTASAGTLSFDQPDDRATHDVFINSDGSLTLDAGDVQVATVEVHPGRIVDVTPAQFGLQSTDWDVHTTRGSPPSYFVDTSEPFPDRLEQDEVVRQFISSETQQALQDARDAGDVQTQLDHILDILDVIDLN